MPIAEFVCDPCEMFFEKEYDMGKLAKKAKCPMCEKFSKRYYGNQVPNLKFVGADFHTVRRLAEKGLSNAQDITEFYEGSCKASEQRMETGYQAYRRFEPRMEYWEKKGARRRTEKERDQAATKAKDMAVDMHKKAGLDIQERIKDITSGKRIQ